MMSEIGARLRGNAGKLKGGVEVLMPGRGILMEVISRLTRNQETVCTLLGRCRVLQLGLGETAQAVVIIYAQIGFSGSAQIAAMCWPSLPRQCQGVAWRGRTR